MSTTLLHGIRLLVTNDPKRLDARQRSAAHAFAQRFAFDELGDDVARILMLAHVVDR